MLTLAKWPTNDEIMTPQNHLEMPSKVTLIPTFDSFPSNSSVLTQAQLNTGTPS